MDSKYLFSTKTSRVYNGTTSAVSGTSGAVTVRDTKFTNLDVTTNTFAILDATKSGKTFSGQDSDDLARKGSSINGIIKNHLDSNYDSEIPFTNAVNSSVPGTMQSSALIFNGRNFSSSNPIYFVSYIHKPLTD